MSSISKRATLRQRIVMRIVHGAAINASHAHPGWNFDPRLAWSIAKRATGTLTAQWPDVLAAPSLVPSESQAARFDKRHGAVGGRPATAAADRRRAARLREHRASLRTAHVYIGTLAGNARKAGQTERYEALVDALRLVRALINGDTTRPPNSPSPTKETP